MSALRSVPRPTPLLDNGDRLDRAEFHRRYEAMPNLKKAELIEGVVYLGSPVSPEHGRADTVLSAWLGTFQFSQPGLEALGNATVILSDADEVQPDVCLRRIENGTSRTIPGAIAGPPELVVEIAASSVSRDLHMKKDVYERSGVQEYIVWRVLDEQLDWFFLVNSRYERADPDAEGIIESRVFPGLRLAVTKLLEGDFAAVLGEPQRPT